MDAIALLVVYLITLASAYAGYRYGVYSERLRISADLAVIAALIDRKMFDYKTRHAAAEQKKEDADNGI